MAQIQPKVESGSCDRAIMDDNKVVDVMVRMADLAEDAGLCGIWYPVRGTDVGAICMRPVEDGEKECPKCRAMLDGQAGGDNRVWKLVRSRDKEQCQ
ncbi:MAG TPA: hypothetical protein VD837_14375 [Terriglobales bacterium]|nr:hypothetical protein [Terriglobales bacterium]